MIRAIQEKTDGFKSLQVGPASTEPNVNQCYPTKINLGTTSNGLPWRSRLCLAALLAPSVLLAPWSVSVGLAEVTFNEKSVQVPEITPDLGALGSETSNATMACWQGGKEVFSAEKFNTVLLGGLAGESAITLKNNGDGSQALAISLDNGLCFVTIEP